MKKSAKKLHSLIAARKRVGLTQAAVATHFGVSLRTYCHWEAGTTSPADRAFVPGIVQWLEGFAPPVATDSRGKKVITRCAPLVAARRKAALTQLQAAQMLRVSLRAYCHWEAGTTSPQGLTACIDTLARLRPPAPCVLCGHVGRAV